MWLLVAMVVVVVCLVVVLTAVLCKFSSVFQIELFRANNRTTEATPDPAFSIYYLPLKYSVCCRGNGFNEILIYSTASHYHYHQQQQQQLFQQQQQQQQLFQQQQQQQQLFQQQFQQQ